MSVNKGKDARQLESKQLQAGCSAQKVLAAKHETTRVQLTELIIIKASWVQTLPVFPEVGDKDFPKQADQPD